MKIFYIVLLVILIQCTAFAQVDDEFASEPTQNTEILSFSNPGQNSIGFTINKGDGKRRLVVVLKEQEPGQPIDTNDYLPSPKYGKGDELPDGGYVTHFSEYDNYFQVDELEAGTKYFFKVFDANGFGNKTNYLLKNVASSSFMTAPEIPVFQNPYVTDNIINIEWNIAKGAESYVFQASYNNTFSETVAGFDNTRARFNRIQIPVTELKSGKKALYFRVKSKNKFLESEYSQIIQYNIPK